MLIHEMKFVVDNYAIDKTQVDYILKSDKEYLYLNNALEYTWINIKSNINRCLRAHMYDTTYIHNETEKLTHNEWSRIIHAYTIESNGDPNK